jgi:CHRD domain-containing protein
VIATSAANPAGEIRGQITPDNVTVVFSALAGSQEVPPVTITASGVAAATVDAAATTLTVHVNSTGVDDATAAEVDAGAAGASGAKLVALTKDSVNMGHWSTELATVAASDLGNFNANKLYVNVKTPADPNGAIRGQITASATPPPAAPTLTQLKSSAFSVCGGCHTGGGTSLPASMDLTPSHIYASIVGVASVEQPALQRVKPGDPDNSYVVQKLEGAPTISGVRMPFGGPYLDQATIDQVRAWITAGAANN